MKLEDARAIARQVVKDFEPACDRIEIAGSIRRERPEVNDIDIVLQPMMFFSEAIDATFKAICKQVLKNGPKIKMGILPEGIQLDVYVADADTFDTLLLIRTGSKEHNVFLTSLALQKGGKLHASGAGLADNTGKIIARTEKEIFEKLGLEYVEPKLRERPA